MATRKQRSKKRRDVNAKKVREKASSRGSGGFSCLSLPDGKKFLDIKGDTIILDVIPYEVSVDTHPEVNKGDLWYERPYAIHRNIGPDEKSVACPRITLGKKCPICELWQKLKKDVEVDDDVADAFKPSYRVLYNVKLRGKKAIQVLDLSHFNFGKLLDTEIKEGDEANSNFSSMKSGKSLKIRWSVDLFGSNKFYKATRIDFLKRVKPITDEHVDATTDLDKIIEVLDAKELKDMLKGMNTGRDDDEYEDDEDEDEIPMDYGDDEDDEDEDYDDDDYSDDDEDASDEDEDEEDYVDDEDDDSDSDADYSDDDDDEYEDDEDEEEDEEEDEPPRRKKKSSPKAGGKKKRDTSAGKKSGKKKTSKKKAVKKRRK